MVKNYQNGLRLMSRNEKHKKSADLNLSEVKR